MYDISLNIRKLDPRLHLLSQKIDLDQKYKENAGLSPPPHPHPPPPPPTTISYMLHICNRLFTDIAETRAKAVG